MRRPLLTAAAMALFAGATIFVTDMATSPQAQAAPRADAALAAAIAGPQRSAANRARDPYRHPAQTLHFLGIKDHLTVVEIWPGTGWYTEILAPYLKDRGRLIIASPPGRGSASIEQRLAIDPDVFTKVERANFPAVLGGKPVAPGTADLVVTFRNVHNWRMGAMNANNTDYAADAFQEMFAMLKPGGILGVVDHRLNEDADASRERSSGYIKVSTIRALAEQAGFKLVATSEINANPKDRKDYPNGVWTLPPVLKLGEQDRAAYLAIGESDRMTLKFIKPRK
jgi:predicted methyltransferase